MRVTFTLLICLSCGACDTWRFYGQLGRGQFAMLDERVPVTEVIDASGTAPEVQARLRQSGDILAYAEQVLLLDVGDRYSSYVSLDRPFALWNIVAAGEFSVEAKTWCYPFAGCAGYRGYFDEKDAEWHAKRLRVDGYDVRVSGVPAYSTLGWFDDPLLSSFVNWPLPSFAGLLFHELAHSRLYLPGDTDFNEAFATFVERRGVALWLAHGGHHDLLDEARETWRVEDRFARYMLNWREILADLYRREYPDFAARTLKAALMREIVGCYQVNRAIFGGRYDRYFIGGLDNARFVALAAYRQWVPAFDQLFESASRDWATFYEMAEALTELDLDERNRELSALTQDASAYQEETGAGDDDRPDEIQCQAFAHHGGHVEPPGAEHDDVGSGSDR